jgi:hypothetical protein
MLPGVPATARPKILDAILVVQTHIARLLLHTQPRVERCGPFLVRLDRGRVLYS